MESKDTVLAVINGPGNERARIIASETITTFAAIAAVGLRFLARRVSKTKYGWDDWLILPALIGVIVWYHQMWWFLSIGFGEYIGEVTYAKLRVGFLIVFITSIMYAFTVGLAKLSILVLYTRAFGPERWARWYIRVMGFITILWVLGIIVVACIQCHPINAYWDRQIHHSCNVDTRNFWLAFGIVDIVTDVALVCLPLFLCSRLKLTTLNKLLLCGAFASGLFVTIISAVRMRFILHLDTTSKTAANITWKLIDVGIMGAVDVDMAVVSACLPTLRPLIAYIVPERLVPSNMRKRPNRASQELLSPTQKGHPSARRPGMSSRIHSDDSQWRSGKKDPYFIDIEELGDDEYNQDTCLAHRNSHFSHDSKTSDNTCVCSSPITNDKLEIQSEPPSPSSPQSVAPPPPVHHSAPRKSSIALSLARGLSPLLARDTASTKRNKSVI